MTALMHERPEAMPEIRTDPEPVSSLSELDEVVWQAWKAIELPEGYRAEIIEGAIELSPTGRHSHSQTVNLFRDDLADHLRGGDFVARQDGNIIHEGRVWVPDLFVVPQLPGESLRAWRQVTHLLLVVEVLSQSTARNDRERKRPHYQQVGVPECWLVDLDARCVERWRPDDEAPDVSRSAISWHPAGATAALTVDLEYLWRVTAAS